MYEYDSHVSQRRGAPQYHQPQPPQQYQQQHQHQHQHQYQQGFYYNDQSTQDRRSAQIYPDTFTRYAQYSPRSSSLVHSGESSPVPSLTHKHSASDASPPSIESSHTSWETSWFQDDDAGTSAASNYYGQNRDSAITFDDSCQYDADDWFAQFRGELDISDDVPTPAKVAAAGDIPVYDAAGNSRLFKSLFSVGDVVGDRQLIIFIRHFYCGVSAPNTGNKRLHKRRRETDMN